MCSHDVQLELITSLPEIIDDQGHEEVVSALEKILEENVAMTAPILETLGNINLDPALSMKARMIAFSVLQSAKYEDLAVVVNFLLRSVPRDDIDSTVATLRKELNFAAPGLNRGSSQRSLKNGKTPIRVGPASVAQRLVLDALRSGIRFNKSIQAGFFKAIETVEPSAGLKVVDVWVLFVLHSMGGKTKARAEKLIVRKMLEFALSADVVRSSIRGYAESCLEELFPSLVEIANVLLRASEPVARRFGALLFELLFCEFEKPFNRQEVLSSVIAHVGSGTANVVDDALLLLEGLALRAGEQLSHFSVFLQGILDFVERFSDAQVRRLFSVLVTLASRNADPGSKLGHDMEIFIMKQLHSSEFKFQRIGMMGVVASVKRDVLNAASATKLIDSALDIAQNLPHSVSFLFDELSGAIESHSLPADLVNWVHERLLRPFKKIFLRNLKVASAESLQYKADNDSRIFVAIANCARDNAQSLTTLGSYFRMLQLTTREKNENDLSELEALLSCPLQMPTDSDSESLDRDAVNVCMFYAAQWFREILNAFADCYAHEGFAGFLVDRVDRIVEIESSLAGALVRAGAFSLFTSPAPAPARETGKGRKKEKQPATLSEMRARLAPMLREFDLNALALLGFREAVSKMSLSAYNMLLESFSQKVDSLLKWSSAEERVYSAHGEHSDAAQLAVNKIRPLFAEIALKARELQARTRASDAASMDLESTPPPDDSEATVIASLRVLERLFKSNMEQLVRGAVLDICFAEHADESIESVFDFFASQEENVASPSVAVALANVLVALASIRFAPDPTQRDPTQREPTQRGNAQLRSLLSRFCGRVLERNWKRSKAVELGTLLELHIRHAEKPLELIEKLIDDEIPKLLEQRDRHYKALFCDFDPDESSRNTLTTTSSLVASYRVMWVELCVAFKEVVGVGAQQRELQQTLDEMQHAAHVLKGVVTLARNFPSDSFLGVAIQKGKVALELFVHKALPLLESKWHEVAPRVQRLLGEVQKSTRLLHVICQTYKDSKFQSALAAIPALKKIEEQLVQKVRLLVLKKDQNTELLIGTLRHKDLNGAPLPSQDVESASSSENEEQEKQEKEEEEEEKEHQGEDEE